MTMRSTPEQQTEVIPLIARTVDRYMTLEFRGSIASDAVPRPLRTDPAIGPLHVLPPSVVL